MIKSEAKVKTLLPDEEVDYNRYENLFVSLIYIVRHLHPNGLVLENIKKERIITNHQCTRNMILHVVSLVYMGRIPEVINTMMDLEVAKQLWDKDSNKEAAEEMALARYLLKYFYRRDSDAIYNIISFPS